MKNNVNVKDTGKMEKMNIENQNEYRNEYETVNFGLSSF